MTDRRVWLALVVLAVVVVAVYWAVTTGPGATDVTPDAEVAATASAPPSSASVAVSSPGSESHKTPQPQSSIWRKPIHVVASDGTAAVPPRYQIAGVKRVQTGRDFKNWMSHFPEQDQKVLLDFDKRFYHVYQGRNPDQIARMAAHGYPMPEDVLAAKFIGTPKLRDMAEQGNIKAAFLLRDRELREAAEEMKADGKHYVQIVADDPQLLRDGVMLDKVIDASASPYRAFMQARAEVVFNGVDPGSVDSGVISALYWAQLLGDNGATRMITSFIESAPNADVRDHRQAVNLGAMSLYGRLLSEYLAGLPNRGCIGAWGSTDPYPYVPPTN